jgi:GNAT superfamily N-acetyltransferase
MIEKITRAQTQPLRSVVLRNNKPPEECVLPTDENPDIFHLGYFEADKIISIGTFFPEDYPDKGINGFRLRGMATDPNYAGKGYGAKLINFAINELKSKGAAYIWCNARAAAVGFYSRLEFEIISAEFDVPGIGPHFDMLYQIK